MAANYVIGIDIGGTNFRMGSVDYGYNIIRKRIQKSDIFRGGSDPVQTLAENIKTLMEETPGACQGICIGFPGTVSKDKTTVLSCPNLPAFDGVNVSKSLEAQFDVPVIIEHEVLLLLTHDLRQYNLQEKDCVIAIYLGTGLGNAIYIHGRLLEGKNGTSGELGHVPVPRSDVQCSCGNIGCIEMYASGKRMAEIHAEHYPKGTPFEVMFDQHHSLPAFRQFLDDVACAIAIEINILDPDGIILSGGILSNPEFPYHALLERIRFRARKPYPAENLNFIRPEENMDQGILGAAMYGIQKFN